MHTLHQSVTRALATIFGSHPYSVTITQGEQFPQVNVCYQDYLTPKSLHALLSIPTISGVEWNIERTMSDSLRHRLLDELYSHPERLLSHKSFRCNVRLYILERFATTDFKIQNT